MEVSALTQYLADPNMSFERWRLVKCAIDLHDATHRKRMFRPIAGDAPDKDIDPAAFTVDDTSAAPMTLEELRQLGPLRGN